MKVDKFKKVFKSILEAAAKALQQQPEMDKYGEKAADLIKKRTRLGYGVDKQGGTKKKLKPLSQSYKKHRQRHRPSGPTSAGKSNLTSSGNMLDSLKSTPKKGKASVGFFDKTNADKAEYVSEDRPFNNLSKAEIKQIQEDIEKNAIKEIKKALSKLK